MMRERRMGRTYATPVRAAVYRVVELYAPGGVQGSAIVRELTGRHARPDVIGAIHSLERNGWIEGRYVAGKATKQWHLKGSGGHAVPVIRGEA